MSIFALHSNGLASSAYKNLSGTQASLNDRIRIRMFAMLRRTY